MNIDLVTLFAKSLITIFHQMCHRKNKQSDSIPLIRQANYLKGNISQVTAQIILPSNFNTCSITYRVKIRNTIEQASIVYTFVISLKTRRVFQCSPINKFISQYNSVLAQQTVT